MIQRQQRRLQIVQRMVDVFHIIQDVALGHEQVLPAVVVEVLQTHAPARTPCGERAKTRFQVTTGEQAFSVVVIRAVDVTRQHSYEDVGLAVIIVILEHGPHTGEGLAVSGERRTGFESALRKRLVPVVAVKVLLHAIVRHEDVRKPRCIGAGKCTAQGAPLLVGDASFLADVLERAIAAIAKKKVCRGGKFGGRTIGSPSPAASLTMFGVPLHVAGNKKMEMAVVVVVEEPRGNRPAAACHACLCGDVGERSVAIVVIQDIFSVVGHEQISKAVVDRKSTRLNSSHGYISYAVFCLKKKNKLRHYES